MIAVEQMKLMLLENPERLVEYLRSFGFANIRIRSKYITFGRDKNSSAKSIVIYRQKNPNLMVNDYAKGFSGDILRFLEEEKGVEWYEAVIEMQRYLGLSSFTAKEDLPECELFAEDQEEYSEDEDWNEPDPLDESALNEFIPVGNERFLQDGITLQTQKKYGLRYDPLRQAIIIPIRRSDGKLCGIKARLNVDVQKGELKYLYIYYFQLTKILFGYDQNKKILESSDSVFVFEAEKSVMQADGFGFYNCVAMGSSSISTYQCQLLKNLSPKRVVLMTDKGLKGMALQRDCERICQIVNCDVYIWQPAEDVPDKASPTDLGRERFQFAIERELKKWEPPKP